MRYWWLLGALALAACTVDEGEIGTEDPLCSDVGPWPELPVSEEDHLEYITHFTELNHKTVRNFSMAFDPELRCALWVAYPMHKCYRGTNTGRSDAWGPDPELDEAWQSSGTYRGYQRGHQIPSADRVATTEMNEQTFYSSNMTPQSGALNGELWAELETLVRGGRMMCPDTLYVVTGCHFANRRLTTTDKAGNVCPVPTHYYKVLLRTAAGRSGKRIAESTPEELRTIGFWVEHRGYKDSSPSAELCMSVEAIEELTGHTFFPGLPRSVKQQNEPEKWGIR